MANNNFSLSANAAIVDPVTGRPSPEFYRFLLSLSGTANNALAGEVETSPGSGLVGGGIVSDGISLGLDSTDSRNVDHDAVTISAGVGLSGGGNIAASRTIDLENTAVTPGTYGNVTNVPRITIDQQGRITGAVDVAIVAGIPDAPSDGVTYGRKNAAWLSVVPSVASTDNAATRFDGTTGAVQNSGLIIDDSVNITGAGSFKIGSGLNATTLLGIGTVGTAIAAGISNAFEVTESLAATATGNRRGLIVTQALTGTAGAASLTTLTFAPSWGSTGTLVTLNGMSGICANTSTGTISTASAIVARVRNNVAGGTITTLMGLSILAPINAGTIGTAYGILIGAQKVGTVTTAYGLYQTGTNDLNVFEGKVRAGGSTAPTNSLSVTGDADISGNMTTTTLRINTAPAVSTTTRTHTVQVNLNGTAYYLLASTTP